MGIVKRRSGAQNQHHELRKAALRYRQSGGCFLYLHSLGPGRRSAWGGIRCAGIADHGQVASRPSLCRRLSFVARSRLRRDGGLPLVSTGRAIQSRQVYLAMLVLYVHSMNQQKMPIQGGQSGLICTPAVSFGLGAHNLATSTRNQNTTLTSFIELGQQSDEPRRDDPQG